MSLTHKEEEMKDAQKPGVDKGEIADQMLKLLVSVGAVSQDLFDRHIAAQKVAAGIHAELKEAVENMK